MSKSNPPETIIIVILTIKQKWSKDNQSASDVLVEFCPTLKTPTVIWQITPLITAKKKRGQARDDAQIHILANSA